MLARFRAHLRVILVLAVVAGAGLLAVLVVFQPQRLFYDTTVREPAPMWARGDWTPGRSGRLRSLAHTASGRALLLTSAEGARVLRLEDLDVTNGPDLHVYLAAAPAHSGASAFVHDAVDLGRLRGNRGDQNYRVPREVDTDRFRSVVIWCRRFSVGFGVAPLLPQQ